MSSSSLGTTEVILQRTPLQRKDASGSRAGLVYFDFTIPPSVSEPFALSFQNYYTSHILLTQEQGQGQGQHKPLRELIKLMKSTYNEAEGQSSFLVSSTSFTTRRDPNKSIRVLLFQPSSLWCKFDIRDLKAVFSKSESDSGRYNSSSVAGPPTLSSLIVADAKLLLAAAKVQSTMKNLPELVFASSSETKRGSKRKDKKKEKKMQMPANPPDGI